MLRLSASFNEMFVNRSREHIWNLVVHIIWGTWAAWRPRFIWPNGDTTPPQISSLSPLFCSESILQMLMIASVTIFAMTSSPGIWSRHMNRHTRALIPFLCDTRAFTYVEFILVLNNIERETSLSPVNGFPLICQLSRACDLVVTWQLYSLVSTITWALFSRVFALVTTSLLTNMYLSSRVVPTHST